MAKIVTTKSQAVRRVAGRVSLRFGARVLIDGVPCTMFRISYVGDLGWEIYTKMEHGLRLWDTICRGPARRGIFPSASACTR